MRNLLLLLNLLPAVALANPPMDGHPPHDEFGRPPMHRFFDDCEQLPPFLHGLDLSDQQKSEIKNLLKTQRDAMDETRDKERAVDRELKQLSFSGDYSEDKARPLIEKSLDLHRTVALRKAAFDNSVFKLLTVEQQNQLKAAKTDSAR